MKKVLCLLLFSVLLLTGCTFDMPLTKMGTTTKSEIQPTFSSRTTKSAKETTTKTNSPSFTMTTTTKKETTIIPTTTTHTHTFSEGYESDINYHWHPSTCGCDVIKDKETHEWNKGVIKSTNGNVQVIEMTCTICGKTKEVLRIINNPTNPIIGSNTIYDSDDEYHWEHQLIQDSEVEKYEHIWSDGITVDGKDEGETTTTYTCKVCGRERIVSQIGDEVHVHTFENDYDYDKEYHYHKSTCGHDIVANKEAHSFTIWRMLPYASINDDHVPYERSCTICGYKEYETRNNSPNSLIYTKIEGGYEITGMWLSFSYDIIVPTSYMLENVISIGEKAFSSSFIRSITISEGVRIIKDFAFEDSKSLWSISLPSTIEEVGESIFKGCTHIQKITYNGTKEEFKSLNIELESKNYAVHCTDGDIVVKEEE